MNQSQLIETIARESKIKKAAAKRSVKSLINCIVTSLKSNGKISVAGLGLFRVKGTRSRKGRNPKTGEAINIPAGKRISFKAGVKLKKSFKE